MGRTLLGQCNTQDLLGRIPAETDGLKHTVCILLRVCFCFIHSSRTYPIPLFCSEHFIVELAGRGRMPSLLVGFGDLIALPVK